MKITFKKPEKAQCWVLEESKDTPEHKTQLHLALPSPETPVEISSFPIEIRSETPIFRPKSIVNLWTQILSIQIQCGNFWRHQDALMLHKDKAPVQTQSREESVANDGSKWEKEVLYIRHRIQKGLLTRYKQPVEAELPEIARSISMLEGFGEVDVQIILRTKIHKVCKAVMGLDIFPGDDTFQIRARNALLYERYSKLVNKSKQENASEVMAPTTSEPPNTDKSAATEDQAGGGGLLEPPAICLTQLTPQQCARIEEAAKACNPPLKRGVVELMCMLPHFTSKYGARDLQIIPQGRLVQPFHDFPEVGRGVYKGGPIIPPQMLQLTSWVSPNYGFALFVDTDTGEGLQLQRFSPYEKDVLCAEFDGQRRPIEELLQEWIDCFLKMKIVPSGGEDLMSDEFRSMDYLKQKFLLQEYGWPNAFPLSPSKYASLIKRQADLHQERLDKWEKHESLDRKWNKMMRHWGEVNLDGSPTTQDSERFRVLDKTIEEALRYHVRKSADREYALAADVPLDKSLRNPLVLSRSSHEGADWDVDVTPAKLMERFYEVAAPFSRADDAHADVDIGKMKLVLENAHDQWKLSERGLYPRDDVDEEDDDSTSDFVPSDEEYSDDEEFESDEEEEDLDFDIAILEEDSRTDIEQLRARFQAYQIAEHGHQVTEDGSV
ncbi:hypothetical protein BP5796_02941 [Coleophoma crateriformis]|uniref:Uncharacterized protein n=1 Tax=Coleophoma crateriformis TaxID=565419 RepID=A0A3D8SLQ1_9HELO|nr:hypothetical protein BP5796_02941 [Coleophoma crateriformis]